MIMIMRKSLPTTLTRSPPPFFPRRKGPTPTSPPSSARSASTGSSRKVECAFRPARSATTSSRLTPGTTRPFAPPARTTSSPPARLIASTPSPLFKRLAQFRLRNDPKHKKEHKKAINKRATLKMPGLDADMEDKDDDDADLKYASSLLLRFAKFLTFLIGIRRILLRSSRRRLRTRTPGSAASSPERSPLSAPSRPPPSFRRASSLVYAFPRAFSFIFHFSLCFF